MDDLEIWRVCWHEAGHAIWALGDGRTVVRITREPQDGEMPGALGFCEITPETLSYSDEDLQHLLSGIAGEEVGSRIHGYPFKRVQLEWHQALDCVWGQDAFEGIGGWKPMNESGSPENYWNMVPEKYKLKVEEEYGRLLLTAEQSGDLPRLAATLHECGHIDAAQIRALLQS